MTINDVLICDDNPARVERWAERVRGRLPGASVDTLTGKGLAELLTELSDAEYEARSGQALTPGRTRIERAQRADLVILDSDLSPSPNDLANLQKEERAAVSSALRNGYGDVVARQLRSYTSVGALVVVNMFWGRHALPRVFDLTLTQNANAFSDLTIRDGELDDATLWGHSPTDGDRYRPWPRPTVPEVVEAQQRSLLTEIDLDQPLLASLDIPEEMLSASQLDPFTVEPGQLTLRQMANSRLGFKYSATDPGVAHGDEHVLRMGLSVLRRWLERWVIPSQGLLLDAPHLAERYWQALLSGDTDDVAELDAFSQKDWDGEFGMFQDSLKTELRPFVGRPVFDERRARSTAARMISGSRSSRRALEAGFSEDTSSFQPLDRLNRFPTDVPGEHIYRWLEEVEGVGYEPVNRLLL